MTDKFQGTDEELIQSAKALLELDASGTLVPHGIGGHARAIILAFIERLPATDRSCDPMFWEDD